MRRLLSILTLFLGFTLLAAQPALPAVELQGQKVESGSAAGSENRIPENAQLSTDRIRENLPCGYGVALDSSVAARGLAGEAERGVSVLGHHPGYVNTAESIGARYFDVPINVWAKMSPAQQWAANTRFLDRLIARGDSVVLSPPAKAS